jgi:hypothetical protein
VATRPKRARRPAPATLSLAAAPVYGTGLVGVDEETEPVDDAVPTGATGVVPLLDGYGATTGAEL